MSEHDQQVTVVEWFRRTYPKYRIIAIPNGQWIAGEGKRKHSLINKYKAEGWTTGVSDLFICVPVTPYAGLWLEMKDIGKTERSLSKDQTEWGNDMNQAGYLAKWAAGCDKAMDIIQKYMNRHY